MKLFDLFRRHSCSDPVVVQAGAILVRDPQVFGAGFQETCWQFVERVFALDAIRSITVDRGTLTATVRYSPDEHTSMAVLQGMAAALQNDAFDGPDRTLRRCLQGIDDRVFTVFRDASSTSSVAAGQPSRPARGIRRLVYLALAGGSFGMSVVGILVPGIPTVPFLLLSSYYLVRSSPALNERLLQSRTFGPLMRDWQEHGAMRPGVKVVTLVIMVGVATATVLFSDLSAPLLIVVVLLVALGMYSVLRVPTLTTGDRNRQVRRGQSAVKQA